MSLCTNASLYEDRCTSTLNPVLFPFKQVLFTPFKDSNHKTSRDDCIT